MSRADGARRRATAVAGTLRSAGTLPRRPGIDAESEVSSRRDHVGYRFLLVGGSLIGVIEISRRESLSVLATTLLASEIVLS